MADENVISFTLELDTEKAIQDSEYAENRIKEIGDEITRLNQLLPKTDDQTSEVIPGFSEHVASSLGFAKWNANGLLDTLKKLKSLDKDTDAFDLGVTDLDMQIAKIEKSVNDVCSALKTAQTLSLSLGNDASAFAKGFNSKYSNLNSSFERYAKHVATKGWNQDENLSRFLLNSEAYKNLQKQNAQLYTEERLEMLAKLQTHMLPQYSRSTFVDSFQPTPKRPDTIRETLPHQFQTIRFTKKPEFVDIKAADDIGNEPNKQLTPHEASVLFQLFKRNGYMLPEAQKTGLVRFSNGVFNVNTAATRANVDAFAGFAAQMFYTGASGRHSSRIENIEDLSVLDRVLSRNNQHVSNAREVMEELSQFEWLHPGYYTNLPTSFRSNKKYRSTIERTARIESMEFPEFNIADTYKQKSIANQGTQQAYAPVNRSLRTSKLAEPAYGGTAFSHNGLNEDELYFKIPFDEIIDSKTSPERKAEIRAQIVDLLSSEKTYNGKQYSFAGTSSITPTHIILTEKNLQERIKKDDPYFFNNGGKPGTYSTYGEFAHEAEAGRKINTEGESIKSLFGTDFTNTNVVVVDLKKATGLDGQNFVSNRFLKRSFQGRTEDSSKGTYSVVDLEAIAKLYKNDQSSPIYTDDEGNIVIVGGGVNGENAVINPKNTDIIEDVANIKIKTPYQTTVDGKTQWLSQEEMNRLRSESYRKGIFAKTTYHGAESRAQYIPAQIANQFDFQSNPDSADYFNKVFHERLALLNTEQGAIDLLFSGDDPLSVSVRENHNMLNSEAAQKQINDEIESLWRNYRKGNLLIPYSKKSLANYAMFAAWLPDTFNNFIKSKGGTLTEEQAALSLNNDVAYFLNESSELGLARNPATAGGNVIAINKGADKFFQSDANLLGIDKNALYARPDNEIKDLLQGADFDGDTILAYALNAISKEHPEFGNVMKTLLADTISRYNNQILPVVQKARLEKRSELPKEELESMYGIPNKETYSTENPDDLATFIMTAGAATLGMGAANSVSNNAWQHGLTHEIAKGIVAGEGHYDALSVLQKKGLGWKTLVEEYSVLNNGAQFSELANWASKSFTTKKDPDNPNKTIGEPYLDEDVFTSRPIDRANFTSVNQYKAVSDLATAYLTHQTSGRDVTGGIDYKRIFSGMNNEFAEGTYANTLVSRLRELKSNAMTGDLFGFSDDLVNELLALSQLAEQEIKTSVLARVQSGELSEDNFAYKRETDRLMRNAGIGVVSNIARFGITETAAKNDSYLAQIVSRIEKQTGKSAFAGRYGDVSIPEDFQPSKDILQEQIDARTKEAEQLQEERQKLEAEKQEIASKRERVQKLKNPENVTLDRLEAEEEDEWLYRVGTLKQQKKIRESWNEIQTKHDELFETTPFDEPVKTRFNQLKKEYSEENLNAQASAIDDKIVNNQVSYESITGLIDQVNRLLGQNGNYGLYKAAVMDDYNRMRESIGRDNADFTRIILSEKEKDPNLTPGEALKKNYDDRVQYDLKRIEDFKAEHRSLMNDENFIGLFADLETVKNSIPSNMKRAYGAKTVLSARSTYDSINKSIEKLQGKTNPEQDMLDEYGKQIENAGSFSVELGKIIDETEDSIFKKTLTKYKDEADKWISQAKEKQTELSELIADKRKTLHNDTAKQSQREIESLERSISPTFDPIDRINKQVYVKQQRIDDLREKYTKKHASGEMDDDTYAKNISDLESLAEKTNFATEATNLFTASLARVGSQLGHRLFRQAVNEAKKFVQEFNSAMTEIQVVTLKTDEQMSSLGDGFIKKAIQLKTNISDVTSAAAALYRQGLNDEEVDSRLDDILKFSKISGIKTTDATKLVTVAMNSGMVESAGSAMDMVTALGDSAATSAAEITKGLQKSMYAANEANVSFGELISMLTAITANTQLSGSIAGTTLQSVFSRLNRISTKDGVVVDEEGNLIANTDIINLLESLGIRTTDGKDSARSPFSIFSDLGKKWEGVDDTLKNQIAYMLSGGRQYSNFAAMMQAFSTQDENGNYVIDNYMKTIEGSDGIVDEKYEVQMESLASSLELVKTSFDQLVESFTNTGAFTGFLDVISSLLQGLASFNNGLGQIPGLIVAVTVAVAALTTAFSALNVSAPYLGAIAAAVAGISVIGNIGKSIAENMSSKDSYNDHAQQYQDDSSARAKTIETANKYYEKQQRGENLTAEELSNYKSAFAELVKLGVISIDAGKSIDELANSADEAGDALKQAAEVAEKKNNTEIAGLYNDFIEQLDEKAVDFEQSKLDRSTANYGKADVDEAEKYADEISQVLKTEKNGVVVFTGDNGEKLSTTADQYVYGKASEPYDRYTQAMISGDPAVLNGISANASAFWKLYHYQNNSGALDNLFVKDSVGEIKNFKEIGIDKYLRNGDYQIYNPQTLKPTGSTLFDYVVELANSDSDLVDDYSYADYVRPLVKSFVSVLLGDSGKDYIDSVTDALITDQKNEGYSFETYFNGFKNDNGAFNRDALIDYGKAYSNFTTESNSNQVDSRNAYDMASTAYTSNQKGNYASVWDSLYKEFTQTDLENDNLKLINGYLKRVANDENLQNQYNALLADTEFSETMMNLIDSETGLLKNDVTDDELDVLMRLIANKSNSYSIGNYRSKAEIGRTAAENFQSIIGGLSTFDNLFGVNTEANKQAQQDLIGILGEETIQQLIKDELGTDSEKYLQEVINTYGSGVAAHSSSLINSRAQSLFESIGDANDSSKYSAYELDEMYNQISGLRDYVYYSNMDDDQRKDAGITDQYLENLKQTIAQSLKLGSLDITDDIRSAVEDIITAFQSGATTSINKYNSLNTDVRNSENAAYALNWMKENGLRSDYMSTVTNYLGMDQQDFLSMFGSDEGLALLFSMLQDRQNEQSSVIDAALRTELAANNISLDAYDTMDSETLASILSDPGINQFYANYVRRNNVTYAKDSGFRIGFNDQNDGNTLLYNSIQAGLNDYDQSNSTEQTKAIINALKSTEGYDDFLNNLNEGKVISAGSLSTEDLGVLSAFDKGALSQNDVKTYFENQLANNATVLSELNSELYSGDILKYLQQEQRFAGTGVTAHTDRIINSNVKELLKNREREFSDYQKQQMYSLIPELESYLAYTNEDGILNQTGIDAGVTQNDIDKMKQSIDLATAINSLDVTADIQDSVESILTSFSDSASEAQKFSTYNNIQSQIASGENAMYAYNWMDQNGLRSDYLSTLSNFTGMSEQDIASMWKNAEGRKIIQEAIKEQQSSLTKALAESIKTMVGGNLSSLGLTSSMDTGAILEALDGKVEDWIIKLIENMTLSFDGNELNISDKNLKSGYDSFSDVVNKNKNDADANSSTKMLDIMYNAVYNEKYKSASILDEHNDLNWQSLDSNVLSAYYGYLYEQLSQEDLLSYLDNYRKFGSQKTSGYYETGLSHLFGGDAQDVIDSAVTGDISDELLGLMQRNYEDMNGDTLGQLLLGDISELEGFSDVLATLANTELDASEKSKLLREGLKQASESFKSKEISEMMKYNKALNDTVDTFEAISRGGKDAASAYNKLYDNTLQLSYANDALSKYKAGNRSDKVTTFLGSYFNIDKTQLKKATKQQAALWTTNMEQSLADSTEQMETNLDYNLNNVLSNMMAQLPAGQEINLGDFVLNGQVDTAGIVSAFTSAGVVVDQAWLALISALSSLGATFSVGANGNSLKVNVGKVRSSGYKGSGSGSKGKSAAEKLVTAQKEGTTLYEHQIKMIQYEQTKYENAGELTNYGKMLEEEIKLERSYLPVLQENIAALRSQLDATSTGSEDWYKLRDAILEAEEKYSSINNTIRDNTRKLKENQQAIYKLHTDLEDTVVSEIETRIQAEEDQLNGTVSMQNTVLDAIKQRYQDEWDLVKRDIQKKKDALEEEKSLIDERLQKRKDAEDEAEKYEELAEYKKQLALIEMDSTRTKDAASLRKKIADLEKEIAWDIAEKDAENEKNQIGDQINAYDDYISEGDENLDNMLEDATNFAEEVNGVMKLNQTELFDWLKNNVKEYTKSLEEAQKQMVNSWTETYKQMKGITDTYWGQVNDILGSKDSFLAYMKNSQEYINASEDMKKQKEYEWSKMYDDWVNGNVGGATWDHDDAGLGDFSGSEYTGESSGGSGNGGGGRPPTSTEKFSGFYVSTPSGKIIYKGTDYSTAEAIAKRYHDKNRERVIIYDSNGGVKKIFSVDPSKATTTAAWYVIVDGKIVGKAYSSEATAKRAAENLQKSSLYKNKKVTYKKYTNIGGSGSSMSFSKYATGGIVDRTGLAWLDGTPSKPERILSAKQTSLFDNLVASIEKISNISPALLQDMFNWSSFAPNISLPNINVDTPAGGNRNVSIGDVHVTINSAEISDDRSIDELAERVGTVFVKNLTKQGFNLVNYAF